MLHEKIDSEIYKADFIKKFTNFCEKAPVLLSFITSDQSVIIIHTNSEKRYTFDWEFTTPVKSFIFNIKEVLVAKHYPRLIQEISEDIILTPEEQADLIANGADVNNLPTTRLKIEKILWRIDRVIVWRDIFILVNEATDQQFRYKMNKSCIYFLKNYRSGKYTLESAADYFFANSILLNKIENN